MKTKIKRHSRSVLSVILAICILISCMMVGLIATDAAKGSGNALGANADDEALGYSDKGYVRGEWDNWAKPDDSKGHLMTGSGYTVYLPANKTYEFVFAVEDNEDVFRKDMTFSTSVSSYDFPKSTNVNSKIKTTVAGKYTFKFEGFDGGKTCMHASITFPTTPVVADTWTVAGSATGSDTGGATDALFGKSWDPSITANDLTESSSTWTWTKNNVQLTAGTVKYKVVKNHDWNSGSVPANNNATCTISTTGTYNVTVTYDGTNVTMTATLITKSTLSVANNTDGTINATYNGTTITNGGSINNVPQGATITVSVTTAEDKMCSGVTYTPAGGSAQSALKSGTTYTFTMPGANTTVDATINAVTLKDIYFNNSYTLYGSVYAYVYNLDGTAHTYEYLGPRPGTTMTKLDNSNIWHIKVPSNVQYVEFISGEGYTTGEMKIPWIGSRETNEYPYPKYTAPYGYREEPTTDHGGTWGNYVWGETNKRDNVYTVTDGSTMGASGLFTGITATMYDYYTDNEITSGWLNGIKSDEYNMGEGWKWDPYTKLNQNLSAYADTTNAPKYDITYPLYFGNLAVDAGAETTSDLTKNYYHFNRVANNSQALTNSNNAVTGLTGTKLADSTIHNYKSGATNENGAPMAMFDEDFLSGENKTGDTLASILRTSSFPVRKEDKKVLVLDLSGASNASTTWEKDGAVMGANFHNGNTTSGNKRVLMTSLGNHKYSVEIPSGYTQVEWLRLNPSDTGGTYWNHKNAEAFGSNNKYSVTVIGTNWDTVTGSWSNDTTIAKGHTYYEYDSTDGKDNAFITNINKTSKTANIDYYADSSKYVQSRDGKKGFFPFDYNNIVNEKGTIYLDTTNISGGYSYWAHFFTGSNTRDVKMEQVGSSKIYKVGVPGNYANVIFTRNSDGNAPDGTWSNVWNKTGDLTVPAIGAADRTFSADYDGDNLTGSWTAAQTVSGDGYSDATGKYAHDQGFGVKLNIQFTLNENGMNVDGTPQTFDFSGDDDLWVFVDDKLVLDLGGAHGATTGSINFNTKTVTANSTQPIVSGVTRNGDFGTGFNENPNYVHTMTIYYMERGMFDSNLKFGFSFHAIPNMFWIDKKIRTKDIINGGFYIDNEQTGTASNKNTAMTASEGRFISNFEKSYQDESFTVTHKYGSTEAGATTAASGKKYTIDNDENVYETPLGGTYPIKHDLNDCFVGQFTKNDYFNLIESYGSSNKYVYDPTFSVWDQANNDKAITANGDNNDGFTFQFKPTTTVTTTIDNVNIKARFENYMKAHTLTLKKELENVTDPSTDFTFQVLFDFDYDGESGFDQYIAYPLYCDVDGVRTKLSNTGTITVKAGQVIEIEEIPEKAKIKVVEVMNDAIDGYRYNGFTLTKGGNTVQPTENVTKGIVFAMGDADMTAVLSNRKPTYSYTIKYNYKPYVDSYSTQSYTVKGVFTGPEIDTFLTLDSNGQPTFKSADLKKDFVNIKAPYEDNFHELLSFANSTIIDTGEGKGWANDGYNCEVTATATSDALINARFNLPYDVDSDSSLIPKEKGTSKRVEMISYAQRGNKDIDCFDWYVTAGKSHKNKSGSSPVFVKAPLIIYTDVNDDNTAQYFQYWSVRTQSSYGMKSQEYTRCYDYEFNFALFTDCIIQPVYGSSWHQTGPNPPTKYDMYDRYNPELQILGDSDSDEIKIAFLENSRNQYNNDGNGGRTTSPNGADVIYSDFLLNFNYVEGMTLLKNLPAGKKKAGIVVEAINYMNYQVVDGQTTTNFDTFKDYKNESSFNSNESTQSDAIVSWLQGGNKPLHVAKSEFDVSNSLDNKNCIQYYYSLNNRSYSSDNGGQLVNNLQNRYKVFRAYAYIGNVSGNNLMNVKISDPVYFTIYDAGSQGLPDNKTN